MAWEDVKSTGSLDAANEEVRVAMPSVGSVAFQITATFTATITFEASVNATDYVAVSATNLNSGAKSTTATTTGIYIVHAPGARYIRARISAYTSGTAVVYATATTAALQSQAVGTGSGSAVDTELPPAVAVGDNITAENSPTIIAFQYGYDGSNWDRNIVHPNSIDGRGTTLSGPVVQGYNMGFNGTSWDRTRTELSPYPTGTQRVVAGGYTDVVSGTLTRPANTTAYAADDEVATASTSPLSLNLARANGLSGLIVGATLIYSNNPSTTPQFRLLVFDQTVTLAGDNAALALSDADAAKCIGFIDFNTSQPAAAGTSGALIMIGSIVNPISFEAASGSQAIFFALVTKNAFTPIANSETIEVRVRVEAN